MGGWIRASQVGIGRYFILQLVCSSYLWSKNTCSGVLCVHRVLKYVPILVFGLYVDLYILASVILAFFHSVGR